MTNTYNFDDDNNNNQPVDPYRDAAETLQFGDPQDAAIKLRGAIGQAMQEGENSRRLQSTLARSMEELQEFKARNPSLNDDMVEAAIERRLIKEQLEDLKAAGADIETWSRQLGRTPNAQDIAQGHLHYRAAGQKVRGVTQLLESATDSVTSRFGIPRKTNDPSETVRAQQNAARARRGLPPIEAHGRSSDSDNHVATDQTPQDYTRHLMGWETDTGGQQAPAATLEQANRSNAVSLMVLQRKAARGTNVNLMAKG